MIQQEIINPYRSIYRALIAAAFLLNGIALFGFSIENKEIAFWIGFTQFSFFGLGIALLIFGRRQAHVLHNVLNSDDLLVRWEFPIETAKQWSGKRYIKNKNITGIVTIVLLFAGPLIAAGMGNISTESGYVLGTILGGTAFLSGRLYSYDTFRRNLSPPHDISIARDRAYIFNRYFRWNSFGRKIESASIASSNVESEFLSLTIVHTFLLSIKTKLRIPVPTGKRKEAEEVVQSLLSASDKT